MMDDEIRIIEDEDEIEYVNIEKSSSPKSKKSGGGPPIVAIIAGVLILFALVLGGVVIYKTLTERAKMDVSDIRPVSAEYLMGRYAIRIYPNKEGDKSFMRTPIKIIHAKSDMINYVDEKGESDILDKSFCDEYWMDYESYLKIKDLDADKYKAWISEVEKN